MLSVSPLWWRVEQADALTRQKGRKLLHVVSIVANLLITGVEGHHPNQPKPLGAGGVVGFMGGTLAAAGAVSVTYSHADLQPATLLLYVAGV